MTNVALDTEFPMLIASPYRADVPKRYELRRGADGLMVRHPATGKVCVIGTEFVSAERVRIAVRVLEDSLWRGRT